MIALETAKQIEPNFFINTENIEKKEDYIKQIFVIAIYLNIITNSYDYFYTIN